jgi:hypothetical protein
LVRRQGLRGGWSSFPWDAGTDLPYSFEIIPNREKSVATLSTVRRCAVEELHARNLPQFDVKVRRKRNDRKMVDRNIAFDNVGRMRHISVIHISVIPCGSTGFSV